jgi:hypothetical protein
LFVIRYHLKMLNDEQGMSNVEGDTPKPQSTARCQGKYFRMWIKLAGKVAGVPAHGFNRGSGERWSWNGFNRLPGGILRVFTIL